MAKERIAAEWREIDLSSLTGEAARLFNEYRAQYQLGKEAKSRFEGEMIQLADLPEGFKLIFGYNFGKLSVAVVPDDKPKVAKPATLGLAEWLAAQASSGQRA